MKSENFVFIFIVILVVLTSMLLMYNYPVNYTIHSISLNKFTNFLFLFFSADIFANKQVIYILSLLVCISLFLFVKIPSKNPQLIFYNEFNFKNIFSFIILYPLLIMILYLIVNIEKNDYLKKILLIGDIELFICALILLKFIFSKTKGNSTIGIHSNKFFVNLGLGIFYSIILVPVLALVVILLKFNTAKNFQLIKMIWYKNNIFNLMLFGYMVIIVPFCEEIIFRSFIYVYIRKFFRPFWAIILVSFIFGYLHSGTVFDITKVMGSLVMTYIFEKRKSVFASLAVHSFFNFCLYFIVFIIR